jgi:hypothetical protein
MLWSKRTARLDNLGQSPYRGPDHSGRTFGTFAAQRQRQISVDRRGALLLSDLLADRPDEGLCINWERSSLEDHGQLGGDLL